ncbi:CorA family magnesium ion transporter [Schizosaccharomyces japonicus yFS275]|uniref:CorA family magnesium ion transporter n=1 Tax=Schizosaccharomyces japonicus (strain yFS275 / FY16936) TaxID=402676 RepID=B6K4F8_SCHJY|nr:CorA family magnesium ion transporter [Schizosaccharomyces japonicus yFS275]EEB08365.1 CorA family magnesium ion transporter [Schizosaccharomyces japonicus yFS275]
MDSEAIAQGTLLHGEHGASSSSIPLPPTSGSVQEKTVDGSVGQNDKTTVDRKKGLPLETIITDSEASVRDKSVEGSASLGEPVLPPMAPITAETTESANAMEAKESLVSQDALGASAALNSDSLSSSLPNPVLSSPGKFEDARSFHHSHLHRHHPRQHRSSQHSTASVKFDKSSEKSGRRSKGSRSYYSSRHHHTRRSHASKGQPIPGQSPTNAADTSSQLRLPAYQGASSPRSHPGLGRRSSSSSTSSISSISTMSPEDSSSMSLSSSSSSSSSSGSLSDQLQFQLSRVEQSRMRQGSLVSNRYQDGNEHDYDEKSCLTVPEATQEGRRDSIVRGSYASASEKPLKSPRPKNATVSTTQAPSAPGDDGNNSDSEGSESHAESHADSEDDNVEEDVCFPMQEEAAIVNGIDFDELDAFAAEELSNQAAGIAAMRSRKYSVNKPFEPHWRDLSPQRNSTTVSTNTGDAEKPMLKHFSSRSSVLSDTDEDVHRFSLFSSEENETIHAGTIGDLLEDNVSSFRSLLSPVKGTWWLDCLNPTDAEMRMLSKAFSLHPLTAEDIRVQETREKVELFKSYYFVCFRSFVQNPDSEDYLEPLNMYIIVFREGLLTFHFDSTNHPAAVRRRARQLRDYVNVSSDWLCYALIDDITDGFAPLIHGIETETEAIEDAVLIGRLEDSREMLRRIGECRKKAMGMFRLLYGKADVIKMLAKRCNEQWHIAPTGEIGLYLGDIQDHLVTMTSNLSQFEKILSRTHSNYLAQLTSNSIDENSRMNSALGKITLLGTLLLPMNVITGLFGMNVPVPGGSTTNLGWFFGILGAIVALAVFGWYAAYRFRMF